MEGYREISDEYPNAYIFFVGDTIHLNSGDSYDDEWGEISSANISNATSWENFANFCNGDLVPEDTTWQEWLNYVDEHEDVAGYGQVHTIEFKAVEEMLAAEGANAETALYGWDLEVSDDTGNSATNGIVIQVIPAPPFLPGDVNMDGGIDVLDVVAMVLHITGDAPQTDPYVLSLMDGNGDGGIDVLDVVGIINIIIN